MKRIEELKNGYLVPHVFLSFPVLKHIIFVVVIIIITIIFATPKAYGSFPARDQIRAAAPNYATAAAILGL